MENLFHEFGHAMHSEYMLSLVIVIIDKLLMDAISVASEYPPLRMGAECIVARITVWMCD